MTPTSSIVKIAFEGESVDAEEMTFEAVNQAPLAYKVGDGTVVELKHEVKNIYRLCDKKKPDGSPIYVLIGEATVRQVPKAEQPGAKR
jgi:hypothetical protein